MNDSLLTDEVKERLRSLTRKAFPNEMCAIIYDDNGTVSVLDAPNTHDNPLAYFKIDARLIATLEGENKHIYAIAHSHPNGSADPSAEDQAQMNVHDIPFVIVGMDGDISINTPSRAPLVGRDYVHGTQDCFGIVRDYYARELGIHIPDYVRVDRWWEDAKADSLYVAHFEECDFVAVPKDKMQRHDVLLCRWGETKHVNHALIYLADDATMTSESAPPCIGSRLCLHHPYGGKSGRIILGEQRLSTCDYVVRHRSMFK